MPYIPKMQRIMVDPMLNSLIEELGLLKSNEAKCKVTTYAFFKIVKALYAGSNFYLMGDVDKILFAVKGEFDRRFVHIHEKDALVAHGDV